MSNKKPLTYSRHVTDMFVLSQPLVGPALIWFCSGCVWPPSTYQ